MSLKVDMQKAESLARDPFRLAGPEDLWRKGQVFFVGGDLPLFETLETMFESFCMESTQLFYLTFGQPDRFRENLEMARQIKKNFNARLIAQLSFPVSKAAIENLYAAGVNVIDMPMVSGGDGNDNDRRQESLHTAQSVFPRWSTVSTVVAGRDTAADLHTIDQLLARHILPLPVVVPQSALPAQVQAILFKHLATGWKKHHVPILPLLPLIQLATPLVPVVEPGKFRGLIDRLIDRHNLVRSDLQRHLRVRHEDSLDSAGL